MLYFTYFYKFHTELTVKELFIETLPRYLFNQYISNRLLLNEIYQKLKCLI